MCQYHTNFFKKKEPPRIIAGGSFFKIQTTVIFTTLPIKLILRSVRLKAKCQAPDKMPDVW